MFSLNMDQDEIEIALKNHVSHLGIDISSKDTNIKLIAGRGENGMSAIIELIDKGTITEPLVIKPTEEEDIVEVDPEEPGGLFGD